jgi:O-antigen ligase
MTGIEKDSLMEKTKESGKGGLVLIILYMFLEYVRPQSFIPGLGSLHIPMFVQIAIFLSLLTSNIERLKSKESITFLLLLCLMAFHVPIATNNYWAYQITKNMALQFVVFLGVQNSLHSFKRLNLALTLWIVVAILCGVRGYFEGGRIAGSGILGDENDYSLFLNMMIPLAFFTAYNAGSKPAKLLFYGGVVILILGTVASMSRGGFLGMVPPLLYCWWKTPGKIKTTAAAGFIGACLIVAWIPDQYWTEMKTIREGTTVGTGSQRAYLWKHGLMMFEDHPLLGVGPGNFNWNLRFYESPDGFEGRSQAGRPSHSIYMTMLPELGLVGAFLFFKLIWVNQNDAGRLRKKMKEVKSQKSDHIQKRLDEAKKLEAFGYGLTGAILAYLISGAFLSVLYYGHFWLIIAFSTANNSLLRQQLQQLTDIELNPEPIRSENRGDRWQYAGGAGDYPVPR